MEDARKKSNQNSLGARTLHGMLWGYIGKLSEFALAFTFSIIVARRLGPVAYGRYNLFISIITTSVLFFSFGLDAILNKFIPQLKTDGKITAARLLFYKAFYIRILILTILGIILWIFGEFLANFFSEDAIHKYSIFFFLLLLGTGIQNLFISYFNSLLRLKEITIVRTLSQSLGLIILITLFMYFGYSLKAVLQAVFFSTFLSISLFLLLSTRLLPEESTNDAGNFKSYVRFGLSVWQIDILTYAMSATLNILLMGRILKDPVQIGFYSTALLFSYLPWIFITSWSKIILPAMSEVKTKYGLNGISEAFVNFSKVISIMLIPTWLFLGRYANVLISNLFGEKFLYSSLLIQVYTFFVLIGVLAMPHLSLNTLYALDKEKFVLKTRLVSGVINITLVFLLVFSFKALGAMVAYCIAGIFQNYAEFFAVRKYVPMKYPFVYLLKIALSAIGVLLLFAWIPVSNLPTVIIIGVAYLIMLFIIFHFIKLLTPDDKKFLNRMHPNLAKITRYF